VILLNGARVDDALAHARGLHYGDGVFRTLLVFDGQPRDLERHLDKLAEDCARLHLDAPERATLAEEIQGLARGEQRAVIKLIAMRRAEGRGYAPATDATDRLLLRYPAPRYTAARWDRGIAVSASPVALAAQPALAGVKHLNRLEQVLASRDWPEGVDEAIQCDGVGNLRGGTRSNLFWVSGGTLCTPSLDSCGVAGVTRHKIMDLATQLHVTVAAMNAPWTALQSASEIFVCNALIGLWPVRRLPSRELAAPGPLTRRLLQALDHPRLA
jgi:4-amino-4-deoxychorismate lyase